MLGSFTMVVDQLYGYGYLTVDTADEFVARRLGLSYLGKIRFILLLMFLAV